MRRTPHPFALLIIVLGVLMLMFAPGGEAANAQDDLVPVPVVIEETSEAPDPQPVDPTVVSPEETATVEAPTEELIPSATPTSEGEIELPPAPTAESETPAPPTPTPLPTEGIIFYDDFETDLSKWVVSQGVLTSIDNTGNRVASLPGGGTLQPFNFPSLSAFELAVWFSPAAEGGLNVQFGNGYTLSLSSDAPAALVGADGTTLATGETALAADTWRLAELLVQENGIALAIDGVQQFAFLAEAAHSAGQIVLSGAGNGASVDDVSIAIPEEEEIEPSPTPSVTPTPGEPVSLEMNRDKLDGVLLNVLDLYATGDSGAAFGMANNYRLQVDRQSRISVTIWAAEGYSGQQVANQIEKVGGSVEVTEAQFVRARVSLEGLAALSLKDQVSVILLAERLASTDVPMENTALNIATRLDGITATIGDEGTEGFNIVGAQAWHAAGFTGDIVGTPIRIGVIDIGFGAAENVANNPDLTCLNSYPNVSLVTGGSVQEGDSRRGRDMVEVICDVAPNAKVRLYKVSNTSQLASAIDTAASNNRIIVIGVDLGVNASPGDGTLGRADVALDPYAKIIAARQDGKIVIASAGNNGNGSVAFNYSGGSTTVQIKVAPGEAVNVGWNDWDTNQNGGAPREDINMNISGAGIPTNNKPARGSGNPGHQFNIPNNCTTDGNGLCTANLALTGIPGGGSPSLVQVQATGLKSDIVSVTGGTFTLLNDAGNIARPGDSPEAITVGAVCADAVNNFPRLDYSSRGPVYAPGGNFTALPTAPFKGIQVKPDVVAPSQVSVRGGPVDNFANWCTNPNLGFGGSEAAAAHVAGMAALLVNNEELTQFIGSGAQQAMKNYLRTHSADLHAGATSDGYDMVYGAGLTSLGSPTFNPNTLPSSSTFIPPNRLPTGQTCNSYVYVGPYSIGSINMDGTILNPYTHPMYAIQAASAVANTCVVLLPGEYVTPWHITELANPVKVYGYSSVVRVSAPTSRIHVQNAHVGAVGQFSKFGGIYIEDTNGVVINGFTFTTGLVTDTTTNSFNYPQIFIADNANGARFSNNRVQNIFSFNTLIEVLNGSNNVHINGNIFRENSSNESLFSSLLISVEDAGTAGNPVQIYDNTFRDNVSIQGTWIINGILPGNGDDPVVRWVSLVKSVDSYIDIVNNVFRNNSSETLIQIVTKAKGKNYTNSDTDEAPFVARILGNAIVGNTMTTGDVEDIGGVPVGLNSGPLINLWHAQKTYIVNNTIARNIFDNTNFKRLIIGRGNDSTEGNPSQLNGSLGSTQNAIEIVNNFVFDNDNAASLFDDTKLQTVGCRALVSETVDRGAKSNWLFKSGNPGACSFSFNEPSTNNITTIDPYPVDENGVPTGGPTYIIGGEDPTNPGFYVLTGTEGGIDGVDDGANGFVQTNLPDFFAGRDVRRATRVRDGDANTSVLIDIGAYETTPLSIVTPIDVPTVVEDSGVITFEFNNETDSFIEGGVPPFSFDITRYPKYFGTHCDARFTFATRGIVIEELDSGLIVASYCPPRDFHTQSSHPFFNIAEVSFDVDVIDSTNSVVETVANYTINQVNDTALNTTLSTEASVAITRGVAQNQVKLRPYVDFTNNFLFSERNTSTGNASTEVDYDFDYTFPTRVNGSQALADAMEWVNQEAGIIGFDLTSINTEQNVTLEYDVEDRNGNDVTNTILIRAVAEPGNFKLLTPQNNSIILDVEEVTEFTWEFANPVETYNFYVEREVDTDFFEPIFSLTDLPEGGLCTAGTCELPVTDQLLVLLSKGRYRWNVEANNQGLLKPANQPFIFNIIGGRELLKNGSFEIKGKTAKLAQNWRVPQIVTGDYRSGKAGAGNGADGHHWYRLTAQTASTGNIKQNARPLGAPGDLLTLSAYVKTKGLQAGSYIRSQITYTNGKKVNLQLNIPKGNRNTWTPLAKTIQLKGIVQKNLVTIQQAKGKGRFDIDLVSLILDQELDFKLIGPVDNATFVAAGAVNTFTWDESGSAKMYDLTITDIETELPVLTQTGLTRKKDADRLTCNKDLCRYTLASSLVEGRYEWTVTASTGFTALNAPFRFDIDLAPTELLKNPGFENGIASNPKFPASWNRVKVGVNDARLCNVIPAAFNKKDTIRAYQGNCAFKFTGRPNAQVRLEQTMNGSAFQVDDQLVMSFVAKTAGLKQNAGRVILTITYTDNSKETLKEVLPQGKNDWDTYEKVLNVPKTVKNLKLQVIHSGATGGYTIDSISVTRLGG